MEGLESTNSLNQSRSKLLPEAIAVAANIFKSKNAIAASRGECCDEYVKVALAGYGQEMAWINATQIENACRVVRNRLHGQKIRLVTGVNPGDIYVRHVESGHEHGTYVGKAFGSVTNPFDFLATFLSSGSNGMYGRAGHTSVVAPSISIRSMSSPAGRGQPTNGHETGSLFFGEVERGNRSLFSFTRHLGVLLANFPNLNGVMGIKGEEDPRGDKMLVLILIERRTNATGIRELLVTRLVDFGPHPHSNLKRKSVHTVLQLPLPPVATIPFSGQHGASSSASLPAWERYPNGRDPANQNNAAIVEIAPELIMAGVHNLQGTPLSLPATTQPVRINLAGVIYKYNY